MDPRLSISISTEISRNLGIMENIYQFFKSGYAKPEKRCFFSRSNTKERFARYTEEYFCLEL